MTGQRGVRAEPVGAYRRAVRLSADQDRAAAEMEDDVHHFAVTLAFDGERVTEVRATGHRTPWTACDGAVLELKRLEGLTPAEIAALSSPARAEHCLHLFDLALLAAAHLGETGFARLYQVEVDHGTDGPPPARLLRDGSEILAWRIRNGVVEGSQFDGLSLGELPRRVADLAVDDREAALILRRASAISFVRRLDLDGYDYANDLRRLEAAPTCFAQQLGRRDEARRNKGSARDFWGSATWPLEGRPQS
jgi:hypothetical protein